MELRRKFFDIVRRARAACAGLLRRRNPAEYFIVLAVIGLTVYLVRCVAGGTAAFLGIFYMKAEGILPDFFNPLRDAAQGLDAYTERHVMYPPLGNLLLRLMGRLLPASYLNTADEDFGTWRAVPAAILLYLLFATVIFVWIAARLSRERHPAPRRAWLTFALLCSFPFLFWLERGNTVLFIIPLLLLYAQNYDSENPAAREVGLFALALAFALKLYPALFGVVLLADRRWREAIRCSIYALLLLIVPSFAYGGPRALWYIVENIARFSGKRSGNAQTFLGGWGISPDVTKILLLAAFLLLAVFLTAFAFVCRKRHLTMAVAAAIMLCIPSVFSSYNWMLMAVPLVLFLRQERLASVRDALWFAALALPFVAYLPHPVSDQWNIWCMVLLFAVAVWEMIAALAAKRAPRGEPHTTETPEAAPVTGGGKHDA